MPQANACVALLSLVLAAAGDREKAPAGGGASRPCPAPAAVGPRPAPAVACRSIDRGSCSGCLGEKCCDLLRLCAAHADCLCMAKCVGRSSLTGVTGCLRTCGVSGSPPGFVPLVECLAVACPDEDECSTPPGFKAPPAARSAGAPSGGPIGAGTLRDCGFDSRLPFDARGAVLQLESADKRVCVRLERRKDGPGSLANTSFTLLSMVVGPLGEVALIKNPTALCWYSSHHNFRDWAHAWTGTRHYDLEMREMGHRGRRTYTLHTFEAGPLRPGICVPTADGGCPIGRPIELLPVNP